MAGAPIPEDWEKYKVPSPQNGDWSQYAVPKKVGGAGSPLSLNSSSIGYDDSQSSLPLIEPKQQVAQRAPIDKSIQAYRNSLSPDELKSLDRLANVPQTDRLRAPSAEEIADQKAFDTPLGSLAKAGAYLTNKASKGGLQLIKGLSWVSRNAFGNGQPAPATDAYFDTAEKIAGQGIDSATGITPNDEAHINDTRTLGMGALKTGGMLAEIAPTALLGGATSAPKAMFSLQGFGQGKETMDAVDPDRKINPRIRDGYIALTGAFNAALMGDAAETNFAKMPAAMRGKISSALAMDAIKQNGEKEITGELIDHTVKDFADNFYRLGTDYVNKVARTGVDLSALQGAQGLAKFGVNATSGQQVFKNPAGEAAEGISNVILNQAPLFGAAGVIGDVSKLTPYTGFKNEVFEDIIKDPAQAEVIKADLAQHAQERGWTPQELDATNNHIDRVADAVKKLPNTIKPEKRTDAVQLLLDRDDLKKQLENEQAKRATLDESVSNLPNGIEDWLTNKIEQANDKLRSLVSGNRTTYSKGTELNGEDGQFFKTVDGVKEEITPSRYELENTERELKKEPEIPVQKGEPTDAIPQPIAESVPLQPTPGDSSEVPIGNTEGGEVAGESQPQPNVSSEDAQQESKITVSEILDRPITYHGEPAEIVQDGQTLVAKIKDSNREYELGNVEDIGDKSIKDLGIEHQNSVVDTHENGNILVRGKEYVNNFSDPKSAINYDKDGNIVSVNLETSDGEKRAFRGDVAEDIAYQIHLKELDKNNETKQQFEQFVEQHEPSKSEIVAAEDANTAEKAAVADNAAVSRKPTRAKPKVAEVKSEPVKVEPKAEEPIKEVPKPKQSLTDTESQRKLELRKKFGGQLNDITRIPTLLADKEFREYAGLVLKETADDFKAWSKELIDNIGEKIRPHLQQLYDELSGKKEEKPIGITREETKKQRELRGLEDLPEADKVTLSQMFDNGKKAIEDNEVDPTSLAIEVADKPQNLSPTEVNALLYDRQNLRQQIEDVRNRIEKKIERGDSIPETTEVLQARQRFLESQLDTNERAIRSGARENSLALNAMKNMINADYTLAEQRARMRAAAGGDLTPDMEAELERYKTERDKAVKDLEDYQAEQANKILQREIDRQKRAATKSTTKESLKAERKSIVDDFRNELKKLRESGALNDVGKATAEFIKAATPFMQKMLTNLVKEGIVEAKDIVAKIRDEFKDDIDGLTDRDVMDALSGKYKVKRETKSELTKQREAIVRTLDLTRRLEDLKNRTEPEKTEKRQVQKNKEITDLEQKIKDEKKKISFETAEERSKESMRKKLDKINERIKNNDFAQPEPRQTVKTDAESIALQSKVKKAENNFDAMAERLHLHSQGRLEKTLTTIQQIRRAMLLSGTKTLGKLYAFALGRSVTTPIEEAVTSLNSKLPGLRQIAKQSPRFNTGFNPRAEAQAITTRWSKATLGDSWKDVLRSGVGELDRLYGKNGVDKDFDLNPSALEFFGRLHAAFKNSTKRAEFFRSFQKRLEYAAKEGKDINDPNVQFVTGLEAYADGKRAILMNDNILVDKGYKSLLRGLEQSDKLNKNNAGKVIAAVIRGIFPIVKIPTNYVLESSDIATFGLRAVPNLVKAMIKGADSLTPKEADMVMRTLAKGQVGLALMIYAYSNPQMFGGYYSGERKDKDLGSGDIKMFGHVLPHWLSHNPYFEAMQIAATMRRAVDKANRAHSKDSGIGEGLKQSVKGVTEQIPFTGIGDIMGDKNASAGDVAGKTVKNLIEPRLIQEVAEGTDPGTDEKHKRAPKGFGEQLESGLPGLREKVPLKKKKKY